MLELKGIVKNYESGAETVAALKGIDLQFRESEFVSILGPSGCGKTTLLNIIGGLDQYTEGDLIINGTSTKKYKDRDWDTYRNHKIGFVFQSYNLIPHQSVLANVELALTLSGVGKSERRRRAKEALVKVGLGDQLKKKPNQMSGGQMQRVAIARALVNNPDIILADEPTGALDTETSVQVMEILKEISKERLIIMVTHNPELAETYSSRIIRMLDGKITDDSQPLTEEEIRADIKKYSEIETTPKKKEKKPSMSFATSFMLSMKNLFTKKGRTTLTAFAGSIGIIGIALILSVSQGTTAYIDSVQEEALSSYPLTLEAQTTDLSALMESFMNMTGDAPDHELNNVYKKEAVTNIINAYVNALNSTHANDLKSFDEYLTAEMKKEGSALASAINGVQYSYNLDLQIYTKNVDGNIIHSDTNDLILKLMEEHLPKGMESMLSMAQSSASMTSAMGGMNMMQPQSLWQELLPGKNGETINDLLKEQYDVVYGSWPNEYNEVVIVVDKNNEVNDMTLYALGFLEEEAMGEMFDAAFGGSTLEYSDRSWTYEEICSGDYRILINSDCYQKGEDGLFDDLIRDDKDPLVIEQLYNDALPLKVVGVIRPNEATSTPMLTGGICYTSSLTSHLVEASKNSEVIKAQMANPDIDILTGLSFPKQYVGTDADKKIADFKAYAENATAEEKAMMLQYIQYQQMDEAALKVTLKNMLGMLESTGRMPQGLDIEQATAMIEAADKTRLLEYMDRFSDMSSAESGETMQMPPEQLQMMVEQFDALFAAGISDEICVKLYDNVMPFSDSTYAQNLLEMGYVDLDKPAKMNIYAVSFEAKDVITDAIAKYNGSVSDEKQIKYTDYVGIMMSSVTTIIDAITYVLIAFVSISLIVSSIMIGVITLISVQERTKEIGILRAIGASKKNVSRMFNAETMIVGFTAGLLGVLVTYLLCIPINIILYSLTDIPNLKAQLPLGAAIILVAISVLLTLISGLIPSRSAAKKDPVVALRTE